MQAHTKSARIELGRLLAHLGRTAVDDVIVSGLRAVVVGDSASGTTVGDDGVQNVFGVASAPVSRRAPW